MVYTSMYNILESIKYGSGNYSERPAFPQGQAASVWRGRKDPLKFQQPKRPTAVGQDIGRKMTLPF